MTGAEIAAGIDAVIDIAILAVLVIGGSKVMAELKDVKELLGRINAATNAVAEKLKANADALEAGNLTAGEEETVVADLRAAAERLESLGADTANPVPAEPAATEPTT